MFRETLLDIREESSELSRKLIAAADAGSNRTTHKSAMLYGLALSPVAITILIAAANLADGPLGPIINPWCPGRGQCTI